MISLPHVTYIHVPQTAYVPTTSSFWSYCPPACGINDGIIYLISQPKRKMCIHHVIITCDIHTSTSSHSGIKSCHTIDSIKVKIIQLTVFLQNAIFLFFSSLPSSFSFHDTPNTSGTETVSFLDRTNEHETWIICVIT